MYQFHGWISLRGDANQEKLPVDDQFEKNLEWLKNELLSEDVLNEVIELIAFDNRYVLTLHAHVNRRRIGAVRMAELVSQVAE